MFTLAVGSALLYFFATEAFEVAEKPASTIYVQNRVDARYGQTQVWSEPPVSVHALSEQQYRNIIHQAYDYSCGSAALTTLLNGYLGRQFTEKQIMDGLLKFGEYDKIVQRRGFSLLDMKRLVTALGHPSGGYKGTLEDLKKLDHPAIVSIHYASFKHFVVVKKYQEGRFFIADPALGNLSFPEARFEQIWQEANDTPKAGQAAKGVMFIVFPNGFKPQPTFELTEQDLRFIDDQTISDLALTTWDFTSRQAEHSADRAGTVERLLNADKDAVDANQPINVPLRTYFRRK